MPTGDVPASGSTESTEPGESSEPAASTALAAAGRLARYDALALLALVWFLAKLLRYALPPLFGTLQSTYGVSTAVVGTTYSALMVAYAATQFPSGALADRIGGARVVAGGAVVAAVGAFALAVPATAAVAAAALPALAGGGAFGVLVAGMVLFGVGTGAHKTVSVPLVSRTYPTQVGRALGAFDTVGALGGVVAPVAVVALLPRWRLLYAAGGVASVALAAAVVGRVPRRTPDGNGNGDADADGGDEGDGDADADGGGAVRAYLAPFTDPRFAVFALSAVLFVFATGGVLAFLPLFFEAEAGLSTAAAGTLYGAVFVGSLSQPLTGELGDRWGYLPVGAAATVVAVVGLAVVAATPSVPALVVGVALLGAGVHGTIPVRGAYLMAALPTSVAGGGLGVVRTAFMTGGAVAPAVVGVAAEAVGLAATIRALVAVAGLSGVGLVALWLTDR
jgi:MFS family permease